MMRLRVPVVWFALACLASAELGQLILAPLGTIAVPVLWPPTGLLAAGLLLTAAPARRILTPISFGITLLSSLAHGQAAALSLMLATVSTVNGWTAAWCIRRALTGAFTMHRMKDIVVLIAFAVAIPMVTGAIAAAVPYVTGSAPLVHVWRALWLAESLGILFGTPLASEVIAERRTIVGAMRTARALEFVAVFAAGLVMTHAVFGGSLPRGLGTPAFVLPFLLYPCFRSGPGGSAATVLGMVIVALWHTAQGNGPYAFAQTPAATSLLRAQGTMAILSMSFMLFAGIIAERKRDAQERARLIIELQRALSEITTLQGLIPICAWCHKVRDDAGFWQQLETYLGTHTGAQFSHAICPTCQRAAHDEIRGHRIEMPLG